MKTAPLPGETLSEFLDGRLQVLQKKEGYRFSVDALLLSRFAEIRRNENVVDLGTGCGIIPLLLSRTTEASSFLGIEVQGELASLAEKNVALNALEDRITIRQLDFRKMAGLYAPGSFDVVLSNPPYRRDRTGRLNPSREKAIARHEMTGTLEELIEAAAHLLPRRGRCYLIYSASRAVDLLGALRRYGLEPKRLQWVYPRLHGNANFVLSESIKAGGPELKVLPPLILHETPLK